MLQVGIHDAHDVAASRSPAPDHGRREAALAFPANHPHREFRGESLHDGRGSVRAVVVHDDQLEGFPRRLQNLGGAPQGDLHHRSFVVCRDDERNHQARVDAALNRLCASLDGS